MRRAIDVRRHLVRNKLGHLIVVVPGLRHFQSLAELLLVGIFHLRVFEDVLTIVEGEHVAVVVEAPAFALVGDDRLEQRMIVLEVRLVHVFCDIVIDRRDHAAVGERRDPIRFDLEDVIGARLRDMLGDRLRELVRVGQFGDIPLGPGQFFPQRPGIVARFERLQARLVGLCEGHAGQLLGGLDGPKSRPICWPGRRGLSCSDLGLAERCRRVGQNGLGLGDRAVGQGREQRSRGCNHAGQLPEAGQEHAPGGVAAKPAVDLLAEPGFEIALVSLVHGFSLADVGCRRLLRDAFVCVFRR